MANLVMSRHLGAAPAGGSSAQIMETENGDRYYVKFKENTQGTIKVLVNEFVAGKIADHLSLPTPDSNIAELDPVLQAAGTIKINGNPVSIGSHFASKKLENVFGGAPVRSLLKACTNKNRFPEIISFDILTYNCDRFNDGNYLIQSGAAGYAFYIIDHGHCFRFNWDVAILLGIIGSVAPRSTIPEMCHEINSSSNFDAAVLKIESITDAFISTLVDSIPVDWLADTAEKDALKNFIGKQRDAMNKIITFNKATLFPSWI